MIDKILANKIFPSPLILEGEGSEVEMNRIIEHALCATETACGNCRSCKQIRSQFHPDLIRAEGSAKIDEVREKLRQLHQKPYESKRRVLAFHNLQDANSYVQNALLKTFEEPLAHWVILVSVNSRFRLLSTIRSRCLIYRVPDAKTQNELSKDEDKIFSAVANGDEIGLHSILETALKERQKSKILFHNLLIAASVQQYPGAWKDFAPTLEARVEGITRNLNPRSIWDAAWSDSRIRSL